MQKNPFKSTLLLGLSLSAVLFSCDDETPAPGTSEPQPYTVSTFAGSSQGTVDGAGTNAKFYDPWDIAADANGNFYVTDHNGHRIRKINAEGVVTTLAGSSQGYADGTGSAAQFDRPTAIAVDAQGNLFVTEYSHRIRKVSPEGVVTTVAGSGLEGFGEGSGLTVMFDHPSGIAVDASGVIYVSDRDNQRIRKIATDGTVSTLAGSGAVGKADGTGEEATFNSPAGLSIDAAGNLYVADTDNQLIRKVSPAGVVTTVAGSGTQGFADGAAGSAQFNNPWNLAVSNGVLYVADYFNERIRMIDASGVVTTIAGSGTKGSADGVGTNATFNNPGGIAVGIDGNLYVTDNLNYRIRKITTK